MLLPLALLLTFSQSIAILTSQVQLSSTADNAPTLQAAIDGAVSGATITLPPGEWMLNSPLRINKSIKMASTGCKLIGNVSGWQRGVVIVGDYNTNVKVNGVKFTGITFDQRSTGPNTRTCLEVMGDGLVCTRCGFVGCQYEGVVVHGPCVDPTFTDCWAEGVGFGGEAYPLPLAGFNSHAARTKYIRCVVKDCGQGFEMSGNGTIADGCTIRRVVRPIAYGFNVGSAAWGIHHVTVRNCKTFGVPAAVAVGNGIGRCSRVDVLNNVFDDGAVTFFGGKEINAVPGNPFEGPDLYGSRIEDNTFIVRSELYGVVTYNTYYGAVYGRENLSIKRNKIFSLFQSPSTPLFQFCGTISGKVVLDGNIVFESDAAPSRGDAAIFTINGNAPLPTASWLKVGENIARNKAGEDRPFVVKIEGQP